MVRVVQNVEAGQEIFNCYGKISTKHSYAPARSCIEMLHFSCKVFALFVTSLGPHHKRMSFEERQECLSTQYFFTCRCEPCTNQDRLEDVYQVRHARIRTGWRMFSR